MRACDSVKQRSHILGTALAPSQSDLVVTPTGRVEGLFANFIASPKLTNTFTESWDRMLAERNVHESVRQDSHAIVDVIVFVTTFLRDRCQAKKRPFSAGTTRWWHSFREAIMRWLSGQVELHLRDILLCARHNQGGTCATVVHQDSGRWQGPEGLRSAGCRVGNS